MSREEIIFAVVMFVSGMLANILADVIIKILDNWLFNDKEKI